MIISHKYKIIFIGLPFSASSAITKELSLNYEGEPYLTKHAIYLDYKKKASKKELRYFVFAVLRNPMDIVVSSYVKMKTNLKGNFTNKKLFKENGGHITIQQRKKYHFIHGNKASFQEYFLKFYNNPYDNLASLTLEDCDFVIRYENISEDYIKALTLAGIKNPRKLPVANKHRNQEELIKYYTPEIKKRAIYIFGPFLKKYNYSFPKEWGGPQPPFISFLYFKLGTVIRKLNYIFLKSIPKRKSIKGTIYGDIQRKKIN